MFERNRIDNAPQISAVPVEITLTDGEAIKGKVLVPPSKTLGDTLNSAAGFIEFEPYGGERTFLAKSQLASVKPVGVPKAPNLQTHARTADGFDPYAILGVPNGAGRSEVREAFVALAKTYHPDRYAAADLPDEVRDYLDAMARRINAAHAALEVPEKRKAVRAEPVFTSPGR